MDISLSEAEKAFIVHGILDGMRSDGRRNTDYRPAYIECGVVSNTSGSSRVRLGNTDILVGIKCEIERPAISAPEIGRVQFFVDCSANATPEFEGRGGEDIASSITSALTESFSNDVVLDLKCLCIAPKFHCRSLYVDVVLLEHGGNVYDAVSLAVKAALCDLEIPKVSIVMNDQQEPEVEVKDEFEEFLNVDTSNVPLMVTVSKIGSQQLVDTTMEEEYCSHAQLILSVSPSKQITYMKQEGKGSLDPLSVMEMIDFGVEIAPNLEQSLAAAIKFTKDSPETRRGFL